MATAFEIQQAKQQEEAQKSQKTSAIIGSVVQMLGKFAGVTSNAVATAIGAIGGTIIGIGQFLDTQKQARDRERATGRQKLVLNNIDSVLNILEKAGNDLIDKGFSPLSGDFEQALYTVLYQKIGYEGNCNLNLWVPGQQATDPNVIPPYQAAVPLQTWFNIKNGALIPTQLLTDIPPNIDTYWSTKCRNIHDIWIINYQDKLIAEGRIAEAKQLNATITTSRISWQLIFGLIVTILVVMVFFRSARIR